MVLLTHFACTARNDDSLAPVSCFVIRVAMGLVVFLTAVLVCQRPISVARSVRCGFLTRSCVWQSMVSTHAQRQSVCCWFTWCGPDVLFLFSQSLHPDSLDIASSPPPLLWTLEPLPTPFHTPQPPMLYPSACTSYLPTSCGTSRTNAWVAKGTHCWYGL